MTIASDIQLLSPSAIIEVFELDTRELTDSDGNPGSQIYLHSGVNGLGGNVVWQGITYNAFPLEVEGFERSGKGSLPRPTVKIANITGLIGALVHEYDDLIGAKLIRRRTFAKYLDSVNYPPARNKLVYTNDSSFWVLENVTVSANVLLNPVLNGIIDADRLNETALTGFHETQWSLNNIPENTNFVFSRYFKAGNRRYAYLKVQNRDGAQNTYATFDLQDGKVTAISNCTPYMSAIGNGWYRCWIVFKTSVGGIDNCGFYSGINTVPGGPTAYPGTTGYGIYQWGAQLEEGVNITEYQPVYGDTYISNPYADPNAHFPDEVWFIDRKASENGIFIQFELAAAFDVAGVQLPRRQCIQNTCTWVYRSAECGYSGGPVAKINDQPTSSWAEDRCGKRLTSCEIRFGANNELPYGGFPGVGLIR